MTTMSVSRPSGHITGLRKAAILLVQLGRDKAATILGMLPDTMVEDLTAEIVRLHEVSSRDAELVLREAHGALVENAGTSRGGMELARALLADGLGSDRADEIMERLGATLA